MQLKCHLSCNKNVFGLLDTRCRVFLIFYYYFCFYFIFLELLWYLPKVGFFQFIFFVGSKGGIGMHTSIPVQKELPDDYVDTRSTRVYTRMIHLNTSVKLLLISFKYMITVKVIILFFVISFCKDLNEVPMRFE